MASEVAAAQSAKPSVETIFDKIIRKQIPASVVYDDDKCLAFKDINPQAPVHVLLIPKVKGRMDMLSNSTPEDAALIGYCMQQAAQLGSKLCPKGFRLVINNGPDGCQSVYHLHIHILGGKYAARTHESQRAPLPFWFTHYYLLVFAGSSIGHRAVEIALFQPLLIHA